MSGLRVGDVVTHEPPTGSVVEDKDGDRWYGDGKTWTSPGMVPRSWAGLRTSTFGAILTLVSTPEPAPAEDWETVTAEQVKVGDEVEVRGHIVGTWHPSLIGPGATIRRRVRTPMAEPVGPAVVRHAGRVLARPDRNMTYPWAVMQGLPFTQDLMYGSWPDVLALDPSTDPVLVDLGAPTGYVLTGDGQIEDAT